jgi:hypothetical protein
LQQRLAVEGRCMGLIGSGHTSQCIERTFEMSSVRCSSSEPVSGSDQRTRARTGTAESFSGSPSGPLMQGPTKITLCTPCLGYHWFHLCISTIHRCDHDKTAHTTLPAL